MSEHLALFPSFDSEVLLNVETTNEIYVEIIRWTCDNIADDETWRYWGSGKFIFRNHSDAVAFKLRWSDFII